MTHVLSPFRGSFRLKIVSSLSLTLLADFLFYGHQAGWISGFFGFLLIGAFTIHNPGTLETRAGRIISLLMIVQCGLLVEKTSLLSIFLIVIGTVSLAIISQGGLQKDAMAWIGKLASFFLFLLHPLSKAAIAYRKYQRRYMPQGTVSGFMRGWFLPVVLSFVFIMLFSSANPIITRWVSAVNPEFFVKHFSLGRVFFWLVAGAVIFSVLRPRLIVTKSQKAGRRRGRTDELRPMRLTEWAFTKGGGFKVFGYFQSDVCLPDGAGYELPLGGNADLPKGITYARYAQQGAYPLIVTALLAAVFVLITQNADPEISGSRTVRGLIYLWVMQNVLLVVSSIYRTNMYVEVYALTYWRVAAFHMDGAGGDGPLLDYRSEPLE
jgi:hypothetical protein